ncbi:MAG: hypothetical protein AB1611_20690 [bacterium]
MGKRIITLSGFLILITLAGALRTLCLAAEVEAQAPAQAHSQAQTHGEKIKFRGQMRADFSQYSYEGAGDGRWQAGTRFMLKSVRLPVEGLGMETDFRYRYYNSEWKRSLKALYEMAVFHRPSAEGIYWKGGRFNLYDLSGIGELDGVAAGWSFSRNFLGGLYRGSEPDLTEIKTDTDYRKTGLFLNYHQPGGFQAIGSWNQITYAGLRERTFLYDQLFVPLWKRIYCYQHAEYELGPQTEDQLSRFFFNGRFDLNRSISMTGSYYQGKGYDYHRMLLEKTKAGLTPATEDLEPYYWYQDLGFRLSGKPTQGQRISGHISVAQRERGGDILPRCGVSYFIDGLPGGLLGERVGGGVNFSRCIEAQTIGSRRGAQTRRDMLSLEMNSELKDWLTVSLGYTNYTFQLVEEGTEIISPPDSSEYELGFSARVSRKFLIYGSTRYRVDNYNSWQNYLSLIYRL